MARLLVLLLYVSVYLLKDCGSFRWEEGGLNSSARLVQCSGLAVKFPWRYALDEGDRLVGLSWSHRTALSEERNLGTFYGRFTPKDDRISQVEKAEIQVSNVRVNDTGIFTVYAQLSGGGSAKSQSATLLVKEPPTTSRGWLQVSVNGFPQEGGASGATTVPSQQRSAVKADGDLRLMCGQFSHLGTPPVTVVWEDPEEHILPSTGYENGYFILDLPKESKGGNYYCLLNRSSEAVTCLPKDSALRGKADVEIVKQSAASAAASMSGGVIAGIVVAVLIVGICVVVLVLVIMRRRKGKSYAPKEPDSPGPEDEASQPFNKVL